MIQIMCMLPLLYKPELSEVNMNKAFTANINDQVTARGYLDENNQLIMLEPEGSGGGGEYNPASILIRPVEASSLTPRFLVAGVLVDEGVAESNSMGFVGPTLEVESLTNSIIYFSNTDGYNFTAVSGAERLEADDPIFIITSNAVITYEAA